MAMQLILCVETNKSADTDSVYILDTIHQWYRLDNKIKISKINMGSKSKYRSKEVVKEITKKQNDYKLGNSHVIYFIDTDQYDKNPEHAKELKEITCYCKKNSIDLIWFCHDVEEVFLGHAVSDSDKKRDAIEFRKKKKIGKVQIKKLISDVPRPSSSNILNIFDKYLIRK